jgi:transposase
MLKAFKVRIYPNKTQAAYIAKAIGCTRATYNMMLHDEKAAFEQFKAAEEHMTEEEDYILATAFIKKTAASLGITL